MSRPRIICVGLACLDYRLRVREFPPAERRLPVDGYFEALGGPAAVAAKAVARLGGSAALWSRRGDDSVGRRIAEMLAAEAIDASGFKVVADAGTPVCAVFIRPDGERFLFPYWSDLPDSTDWLPLGAIDEADAVLVDSRWFAGAEAAAAEARRKGKPVVVDLDRDTPEAWELAALATHVVADEDLAQRLGGVGAALERIDQTGAWGAVTLGSGGVASRDGRLPAFETDVLDSTGAGDVFHGAFALALAERAAESDALHFASAAAALHCRYAEPPHRFQVNALLKEELRHASSAPHRR